MFDVGVSSEFKIAAAACIQQLNLNGLTTSSNQDTMSMTPSIIVSEDGDYQFAVDTTEEGRRVAYEILGDLFDDCPPGDE